MSYSRVKSVRICSNLYPSKLFRLNNDYYRSQLCAVSPESAACGRGPCAQKPSGSVPYYLNLRMVLLGKPLLSCVNMKARTSEPNNCFAVPARYLSFESMARSQSNLFSFLSESTPVKYAQKFFECVHDVSGLPWWASIILTTVIVRSCVAFPLALYQNYIFAKVQNLHHEMRDIAAELNREVAIAAKKFNWSKEQAKMHYKYSLQKQWDKLVVRDNCHPFKASLPIWFQMPVWIFLSVSLRNMAYMLPHHDTAAELLYAELSLGGCLWFPNLTEMDHSWILPITLGIINLAIIELQTMTKIKEPTKFQKLLTNFFRILSIIMVPVAAYVPSCMSIYWVSSSACGLLQNLLALSPRLKRWAGIPRVKPVPSVRNTGDSTKAPQSVVEQRESFHDHPYRHLATQIQIRMSNLVSKIGP